MKEKVYKYKFLNSLTHSKSLYERIYHQKGIFGSLWFSKLLLQQSIQKYISSGTLTINIFQEFLHTSQWYCNMIDVLIKNVYNLFYTDCNWKT